MVEQGDLFMNNHLVCSQSTRTNLLLMTMIWTLTPSQNQTCRYYPDHSCTGWMIECERFKTNPQKMQCKTSTSVLWFGECLCLRHWKHLYALERITQTILHSIKNTGEDLALKQMFEISEQLILEQSDEIFGVTPINWEDSSWKHSSLIGGEEVVSLSHTKVYVFSDSVLCLGQVN